MKKIYTLMLCLAVTSVFAQSNESEKEAMVKAERRSASKKMLAEVNPNTLNYNVVHHKMQLTVNPSQNFINGIITTKFIAKQNMNTVTFDLASGLNVSQVTQRGSVLSFLHNNNDELVITLPATLNTGVLDSLKITYSGDPTSSGFGSFVTNTHAGTPVMWTLSEPFGARDWWPCKQDLNDKVDEGVDVYITTPTQYTAVANGMQQSKTDHGNGTSTTHFKHTYPIPAYLIAIAVTNYRVFEQQGGLGTAESPFFPITNYIFPENYTTNTASVAVTPSIINFFEEKFGPYPFRREKYGHAQFQWGGGMEHTTVSFMTAGNNGRYSRSLIAHEMGHQWFGDKLTCGSWNDIWLNEGFATYLASITIEHLDGEEDFIQDKQSMIEYITSEPDGALHIPEGEAESVNRIFDSRLSYDKGAMVINMLRLKLGDTHFFQALNNYLADPELAYAYVETADLKGHLEAVSGLNLTEFFNDWVFNEGYPTYDILVKNIAGGRAEILVSQTQSHESVSFFEGQVPVRLTGAGGQELDTILDNTSNGQLFTIPVPFTVTGVTFNPKQDIIALENNVSLSTSTFDQLSASVLYPNPASAKLTLQLPTGIAIENAVFYNTIGQVAKQSTTENSWDVSALANGIYFIKVQTSAGMKQLKFTKK